MTDLLSIGEFARTTHLSVKTLRRYHESGLLEPAVVDDGSGYRYYTVEQIPTAQVIVRFRQLGMPTREVAAVLATADPDARAALIAGHLERLEGQLDETRRAVASLRRLLAPEPPAVTVELRRVEAVTVAAVSDVIAHDELGPWYNGATSDLAAAVRRSGASVLAPAGGWYDHELFTEDRGRATVYLVTDEVPADDRVEAVELPAAELAVAVHDGPHDDIDLTYGALGAYVAEHALGVDGPLREVYLRGPLDTDDDRSWRTEVAWPIFRTSPGA